MPGNHEYGTAGAAGYFSYFGARAGTAGAGWYAYDLGTWRIYALNSNCAVVGCDAGSAQEQWLRADLAANPRACVLAYWHHPRFSSGRARQRLGGRGALERPLRGRRGRHRQRARPRLRAVRAADAEPARPTRPPGIREFVVGTGGASLRGFATIRANSQVRNSATHGVIKFTLGDAAYTWQFIPIAGKTFKDSGSGTCH